VQHEPAGRKLDHVHRAVRRAGHSRCSALWAGVSDAEAPRPSRHGLLTGCRASATWPGGWSGICARSPPRRCDASTEPEPVRCQRTLACTFAGQCPSGVELKRAWLYERESSAQWSELRDSKLVSSDVRRPLGKLTV
jgi:hypothetical protein